MRSLFYAMILLVMVVNGYSQGDINKNNNQKLYVGEDLTYVVKYAFLRLGEVRIKIVEKTKIGNIPVLKTAAYIDSYPDLPFVSIHQVYESFIDSNFYPLKFYAQIFDEDTLFVKYSFIDESQIQIKKGKYNSSKLWLDSNVYVDKRLQDGLSVLFFARMYMGEDSTVFIPCFVNEKEEITILNYYREEESISIDSVEYEINCTRLDGETDFVSVYGLTGYFEGWFSNDTFSVPILAKMHVLIGSITLELIKWNKELWNPPVYTD